MKIDKALAIAAITTTLATGGLVDATPDAAQAKPKDCASRYRDLAYAQYMSAQWGQYWVDLVDDGSPQPDTDRAYTTGRL